MKKLGVIFDWDGVVVDSSKLHELSWERLAQKEGRKLPSMHDIGALGLKTQAVISDLLGWTKDPQEVLRLTLDKEELFRCLAREAGIDATPGVLDFLRSLKGLRVPSVVGSSAPRLNIETGMDVLRAKPLFSGVVCGDDVQRGKPAPDIFLKAAERIDRDPEHCVVFEDAPAGVEAAKAAGMRVVALLTTHKKDALPGADRYIRDFRSVTALEIVSWLATSTETVAAG